MNLWPMIAEHGERYRTRPTVQCWECQGTGSVGEGDDCRHCKRCDGIGQTETDAREAAPCLA